MRWLAALAALFASPALATPEPVASVAVMHSGKAWTADYALHERAPLWAFVHSRLPRESKMSWRLATVKVLTPGVRLMRIGNYDALVAASGTVPRRVRLSFAPFLPDLESGNNTALGFSDGSIALYADAFRVLPIRSREELAKISPDYSQLPASDQPTRLTFTDRAGPILARGRRVAMATMTDGDTYVLFGKGDLKIGPALTTLIDPALPGWLDAYLKAEMPRILAMYRAQLGPAPIGQPTLMVAWGGSGFHGTSMSGSVLPGLVVMTFLGSGVVKPSVELADYARWFVAHEAAHFWLGQAVAYSSPAESWITEGGAELLAFRATAAIDPKFDVRARMAKARAECQPLLARPIASAYERDGDFRAYYACGVIIALAAERASGGDFPGFVRALIAGPGHDKVVTRGEWLALLDVRAPGLSGEVAELLDNPHADPAAALNRFIDRTHIAAEFAR